MSNALFFGPGGDLRCTDTTAHDMYSENVCWTPKAAEKKL